MENPHKFGELFSCALIHAKAVTGKTITHLQYDLADAIGRSPHTIEHYKKGRIPPDTTSIYQLVRKLVSLYGLTSTKDVCAILTAAGYPNPEMVSRQLIAERDGEQVEECVPDTFENGNRRVVDLTPIFLKHGLRSPRSGQAIRVHLTIEVAEDVRLH